MSNDHPTNGTKLPEMAQDVEHEEEEEPQELPTPLAEAGKLEADMGAFFDQKLARIDPRLKMENDPQIHQELRAEMLFIREELKQAKLQTLAVRRIALRKLLLKDALAEDRELRKQGYAYAPCDP